MRTLVVAPNWVGDAVMALPTFAALAASGRELAVLGRPHLAPLFALFAGVGEVVPKTDDDRATVNRLRASRFAEAVVLTASFRAAWLPYRAGIEYRWGYRARVPRAALRFRPWPHLGRVLEGLAIRPLRDLLLRPAVPAPAERAHQSEEGRLLLEAMGVPPPASWAPRLDLPRELEERGRERLARARLDPDRPFVGLFPGAEFGPAKRWPWTRFGELARELRRARPDVQIAYFAGPKELWTAVRLHEESARLHPVLGPDLDLAALAGVLAHCDLFITNDSGPMHLAAALGVPCLALFGPTDPARTRPAGPPHQVLTLERWCSPCFRRRCPLLHQRCLKGLEVAAVLAAALEALPASRRQP